MKFKLSLLLVLCLVASRIHASPLGTAFSYQGFLSAAGSPANGKVDFQFSLYDAASSGNLIGPVLTNTAVVVNNGLFLVTLDFGDVFDGSARWLAVGVRTNGGSGAFSALTPLQLLAPTPYALYATNAGAATNVGGGSVTAAQLNTPGGSPASGQVLGYNGTNLIWVSGSGGGSSSNAWSLTGNAGTSPASGNFIGTTDDNPLELHVNGVRALQLMPTLDAPNVIGGAPGNFVAGGIVGSTIGGGGTITLYGRAYSNSVFAYNGTIGGGLGNTIQAQAYESTISGGNQNIINNNANDSSIGGGYQNAIQNGANYSTIAGGQANTVATNASYSSVGGGQMDVIQSNAANSFIGGGYQNVIQIASSYSTIPGGSDNTIGQSAAFSIIGGGAENSTGVGTTFAVIGGGFENAIQSPVHNSTISGGYGNTIFPGANESFIGGGENNSIDTGGNASITGGFGNIVSTANSAIGGGLGNSIEDYASNSVVAGGYSNLVLGAESAVGGGTLNNVGGQTSVISGGYSNAIYGTECAIGGGSANWIDSTAVSVIGGGYNNIITETAPFSTIPGGNFNVVSAPYCFAAGSQAQARNQGCFVWADSQSASFTSTANDQFCVRAQGGVQVDSTTSISFGAQTRQMLNLWGDSYGIGVQNNREYFRAGGTNAGFSWYLGGAHNDSPDNPGSGGVEAMNLTYGVAEYGDAGFGAAGSLMHVMGQLNVDANAYATDFYTISDRNKKENFEPVDARTILEKVSAMPITTWNRKGQRERRLGPMAQDFHAAFGLGSDDKHISILDESGVALAAIQGLSQKGEEQDQKLEAALKEKDAKIAQLENELAEVKSAQHQNMEQWEARFETLQRAVARVTDKQPSPLAVASTGPGAK